jgi:hypothetical protein
MWKQRKYLFTKNGKLSYKALSNDIAQLGFLMIFGLEERQLLRLPAPLIKSETR